jgi:flagellar biosynthesis protein FlhB
VADPDKTEKATPKRREQAREEGNVAKSADLSGAVVMLGGLFALTLAGPMMVSRMAGGIRDALALGGSTDPVTPSSIGDLFMRSGMDTAMALAPVVGICALFAIVVNLAQVGIKPKKKALKPNFKRLNPQQGLKRIFGKQGLVELFKNIIKLSVVCWIVLGAFLPHMTDYAAMVGVSPLQLGGAIFSLIKGIAFRAAFAYLLIGVIDYFWQRRSREKSLMMKKEEVKEEGKGQDLPPEIKGAIRRRQRETARARMMQDVPTADVIVTNPTHYSVALKYDGQSAAPIVIAKGQDLIALKIREIAADAGVPIVPDPPLARSLTNTVEVGQQIPEELFQAVAQILAYVYRVAGRRKLGTA